MATKTQTKTAITLSNTSDHAFIIGPKPRSQRQRGERRVPTIVHAKGAKASDGSDPSRVEVTGEDAEALKGNFVLKSVAEAGIGLEVR